MDKPDTSLTPAAPVSDPVVKSLKSEIESAKRNRKSLYQEWKRSVELRMGGAGRTSLAGINADEDGQAELNPDWSLTKAKVANLFSQVPTVQISHENEQYGAATSFFAKALNYELSEKRANVAVPMEESLNDCINASGVGACIVGYAARFQDVEMPMEEGGLPPMSPMGGASPQTPPGMPPPGGAAGPVPGMPPQGPPQPPQAPPMPGMPPGAPPAPMGVPGPGGMPGMPPPPQTQMVPHLVSSMFFTNRISPVDLLWPQTFTGSCFDNAPWMGYSGRMTWASGKVEFKLQDSDKDRILGSAEDRANENLRTSSEENINPESKRVRFDECYYKRHLVDENEKHFEAIWKIVFVQGMEEPVIHEPWKGQKLAKGKYVGAMKIPIRVLTLTYITDNPIPPSDSAAGRPQVNDLRRSRRQMFENRQRSTPIRWFDVNRIDGMIRDNLMKGTYQGMIPTNGDGSRSIGEIARAAYPSEDLAFDRAAKADLMESWQIGPDQLGTVQPGVHTKGEQNLVQQNFSTRINQERGRVAGYFLGIAEVMAGLMSLYSDFPNLADKERQTMDQAWNREEVMPDVVLKIRPDSTVVLDTQQRIARLYQALNMTAKSGYVNVGPIIEEIVELSGIDPAKVMIQPKQKPEKSNISLRLTGKEDLTNPIVMAMLLHTNQAPTPDEIEAAKQVLAAEQREINPSPGGDGLQGAAGEQPHPGQDMAPEHGLANKVAKRSRDASNP